jgi:REP element-mobilizing transposase RayT
VEGGIYFITVVTYNRIKILCEPENVAALKGALKYVMDENPFTIDAFVLLPEHLHCDYIHYNRVKHGLVKSPKDWQYSSCHRYVSA